MSITKVWERLLIGDIGNAESITDLNPFGITTVVTLCPERVPEEVPGINALYLPLLGTRPLPVGMFDEIMNALWKNIRWGTVFVHSVDGVNRVPIMAAAWMHCCGYKNINAALGEIGNLRTIDPNPILLSSTKEHL
jgi:hypothetical protein